MRWSLLLSLLLALFTACGGEDPCSSLFEPYPDMVSGRFRTEKNSLYLDGMAAYSRRDYATAAEQLKMYVEQRRDEDAARLYLCCAYLAMGKPYDAELQLDFLGKSNNIGFRDQVEWYNALCWLCSGQNDRALEQADRILAAKAHTYKAEAQRLKEAIKPT
jgi:predicted Zn-dependent protease